MPMQPCAPTEGVYSATDDDVHAMEVVAPQRFLLISGTMGLDTSGAPREPRRPAPPCVV